MSDKITAIRDGIESDQPPKPEAKVFRLGCVTKLNLDPDVILENNKGQLEGVVIMGYTREGELITASSYADGGTVLWMAEILRHRLMGLKTS